VSRPSLSEFVSYFETLLKEYEDLLNAWSKERFYPNAYKLMKKASYDFTNPVALGKVVEIKTCGFKKHKKD